MSMKCVDCGAVFDIPLDSMVGEIVVCPDCGLDFVVVQLGSGLLGLQELALEGEDWGE